MKIILTHDVSGLGEPGDVVDVKPGYARNFLFPRGLASAWTRGSEKEVERIRAARKARELESREEAVSVKSKLESRVVRVKVKAGSEGRLFGAVTPSVIADAIEAESIGKVDRRKIEIVDTIKSTGQYQVSARLHPEVQARVKIDVVPA